MCHLSRRRFLAATGAEAAALCLPLPALARAAGAGKLRIGVITDVHQDVMHDGLERITAFVTAMREHQVDFIVQLGDFCVPHARNMAFFEAWSQFPGPRYHVLGNHDTDGGYKREQVVAFYGMPSRYYAFDQVGVRFIVLDANDRGGKGLGYPNHIAGDQLEWLEIQLAATQLPVIVMVHQPLDCPGGVDNQDAVRAILEKPRGKDQPGVAACLTGHLHQDYLRPINGIAYAGINSASYVWLPANARRDVYDAAAHKAHPYLNHVAPYRDPLWAVVTIDHDAATLNIKGRTSAWVGPDPWARGALESAYPRDVQRPAISDRSGPLWAKKTP